MARLNFAMDYLNLSDIFIIVLDLRIILDCIFRLVFQNRYKNAPRITSRPLSLYDGVECDKVLGHGMHSELLVASELVLTEKTDELQADGGEFRVWLKN